MLISKKIIHSESLEMHGMVLRKISNQNLENNKHYVL